MDDKRNFHKIVLNNRENLSVDGVNDVITFDEEKVICETEMGPLFIRGINLHVEKLNLEQGVLVVLGEISAIEYGEDGMFSKKNGGILGRIFK